MTVRAVAGKSPTGLLRFDPAMFERLQKVTGEALISIYVPTPVRGSELQQGRIRLKNEAARVGQLLERAGWKPREREERLSRAWSLIEDRGFWNSQSEGLGVFIDDEAEMIAVALPGGAPQVSVLSHTFHMRPLVGSVELVELPVLVLTRGGLRMYRVSTHDIGHVPVDLPRSLQAVNWFVDREKQRQQHPDRAGFKRPGHGHEGGSRDEDLARYLRAVAQAVKGPIGDDTLIVLGDDNLTDRFIGLIDHEAVSPANSGVADLDDTEDVHRLAAPIVAARSAERAEGVAELARSGLSSGVAITDLNEGLIASLNGRIATLLIDADAKPRWGSFDPETGRVSTHDAQQPFSVDLLDRLVVHAMATGATVMTYPGPIDGCAFVAIPRY